MIAAAPAAAAHFSCLISISNLKENTAVAVGKCYHALQLAVQLAMHLLSPFTWTGGLQLLKSTESDGWLIQSFPMC